jgi:hypothetical protein
VRTLHSQQQIPHLHGRTPGFRARGWRRQGCSLITGVGAARALVGAPRWQKLRQGSPTRERCILC